MTLRLKTVQQFMHQTNPCDFLPFYRDECIKCMDAFCSKNGTTREEYDRKKTHLIVLQREIDRLSKEILSDVRKDPKSFMIAFHGEELNAIEKEIETT